MVDSNQLKLLSEEQLRGLNAAIVSELNGRIRARQRESVRRFRRGEIVKFLTNLGREVRGRIIRLNEKTVTVEEVAADNSAIGREWRVTPNALMRVI